MEFDRRVVFRAYLCFVEMSVFRVVMWVLYEIGFYFFRFFAWFRMWLLFIMCIFVFCFVRKR